MRSALTLTDNELANCIGDVSLSLVREIINKPYCVDADGYVDGEQFAQWFSYALEGMIDADEETDEWDIASKVNYDWGWEISEGINDYLDEE